MMIAHIQNTRGMLARKGRDTQGSSTARNYRVPNASRHQVMRNWLVRRMTRDKERHATSRDTSRGHEALISEGRVVYEPLQPA
eukprot:9457375-Pyramimonas_sp.AAC.1